MRAPHFWNQGQGGSCALLLAPLGWAYGLGVRARFAFVTAQKAPLPVLCVGNFVAGGAGKTPTALALAALLQAQGGSPAFVSRGYGGRLAGPVAADPAIHNAGDTGDEPLLLARAGPAIVARGKVAGAALARKLGASHVILDDGLQNPAIAKDISLAVVDAAYGFGNGHVMPAGPLRASLRFQARLADALVLIGTGGQGDAVRRFAAGYGLPVFGARIVADPASAAMNGKPVIAFAGIARPEKFFSTLAETGARIVARHAFADHHPFSESDARSLLDEAVRLGAQLVTTQKDHVRLAGQAGARGALHKAAYALPVTLVFDDAGGLTGLIADRLERFQEKRIPVFRQET